MIAADTSSWIAFLDGSRGSDAAVRDQALKDYQIVMIPIALTELLSVRIRRPGAVSAAREADRQRPDEIMAPQS
jgi:hypothetical protein